MNKSEAIATLRDLGYSEQYLIGQCGDYAHGSRIYFKEPDAALNEFGQPLEHATASKSGNEWRVAFFGKKAA